MSSWELDSVRSGNASRLGASVEKAPSMVSSPKYLEQLIFLLLLSPSLSAPAHKGLALLSSACRERWLALRQLAEKGRHDYGELGSALYSMVRSCPSGGRVEIWSQLRPESGSDLLLWCQAHVS